MENTKKTNHTENHNRYFDVRRLVFTALMAAISIVLAEALKFSVPVVMPGFIKFDFSDVPAVLASLTMGPISGLFVCIIKNVWGLFTTSTGGVGELSNFILSASLVLPAGIIAHKSTKLSRAIIGCAVGAVLMAAISFPSNYFIVYPVYQNFMPLDAIIGQYQEINPGVDGLTQCLLVFNVPFTFVKGAIAAIVSVLLYKKLRPIFNSMYREK